jgi:hypothetical protein
MTLTAGPISSAFAVAELFTFIDGAGWHHQDATAPGAQGETVWMHDLQCRQQELR